MRPKVVIFTLVAAFGLLGLMALLKGVPGKNANGGGGSNSTTQASITATPSESSNPPAQGLAAGQSMAASPEVRQALIEKELAQIDELRDQVDGTNNSLILNAILQKFSNPEAEVRAAALQALKILNDTNAVPGLQKVADSLSDAREKVTVLDAIDYLKMPDVTANVPPELSINTNHIDAKSMSTNLQFNPNFLKGNKNIRMKDAAPTAPAPAPANPPQ